MQPKNTNAGFAPRRYRVWTFLMLLGCIIIHTNVPARPAAGVEKQVTPRPLEDLALDLTRDCSTDSCKAYRIFEWITRHIDYDVYTRYGLLDPYKGLTTGLPENQAQNDSVYNRRVAEMVLRRGEAICDGYARLYTELARLSGLEARMIDGYGKGTFSAKPFPVNHSWNAVRLGGAWQLLDACWGSGYVAGKKFTRQFKSFYFNTPPQQFILSHYPEDPAWSLLKATPPLNEFFSWPRISSEFLTAGGTSWFPREGHLKLKQDSLLVLRLLGTDSPITPDIGYYDGTGNYHEVFTYPVPDATEKPPVAAHAGKAKRTPAPRAIPNPSGAERSAIDAIMSYVDTQDPGATEERPAGAPQPADPGVHTSNEPAKPAYRTYKNVFEYKLNVPANITGLGIYYRNIEIIRYSVELIP